MVIVVRVRMHEIARKAKVAVCSGIDVKKAKKEVSFYARKRAQFLFLSWFEKIINSNAAM